MQITDLRIRNFRSIRDMQISDIENALILVGKNDTGKTAVLDAVRAAGGDYTVRAEDFREDFPNVEVSVRLRIEEDDLKRFHRFGMVSAYRRYDSWYRDFCRKLIPGTGISAESCLHMSRTGKRPAGCWFSIFRPTGKGVSGTVTGIRRIMPISLRSSRIFILWIRSGI